MQFITVRSKEKDYYIYLKSEKLVHSNQEHEKNACQLFGSGKTGSQLFRTCQTLMQLFGEREKWIPAIWRLKNVVHNCQEQGKRLLHLFIVRKTVSQQLGAQNKCFQAICKRKKLVPSYFETDKHCCSYLEREKSGYLLFGN